MIREYIAQPVMSTEGQLLGIEVLTRFTNDGLLLSGDEVFRGWDIEQKRLYLYEVLGQIASTEKFVLHNKLFCSFKIDHAMATLLYRDSFLAGIVKMMPYLKLQLSEAFLYINHGLKNPVLDSLSKGNNALFLEDLGAGKANAGALVSGVFEAVKIEGDFFSEQYKKHTFAVLIKNISKYCSKIIIQGVNDGNMLRSLRETGIWGVQGELYKPVPLHKIQSLM
ncbi:EAL domain-containing protein [Tenebrionibacter intestinalis]|uniref:EAL domain-containing protein n=1 Tax=Tenebrionibacter intestinalis TaxID=2799638 RepID=A0A8K0V6S4_9ENTR|nr:EAL domain-containing protein [Tenebrionibacter intestinalis]MBK4716150.1 EAL domain-containing protein [Tenebrionibacter intestinalis]